MSYIKQRLIGAFELALLMKYGLSRFDGTRRETLLSFVVLLVTMPVSFIATTIHKPLGTNDFSTAHIYFTHLGASLVSFGLGLLLLYGFAKYITKNTEKIWLFYTTGNWIAWIFIPVAIGLSVLKYNNGIEEKTLKDIQLLLTLYGYYMGGFILFHVFRPPWELAAAFVCGMLVLGQTVLDVAYRISGLPIVDYMEVFG